MSASTIDEGYVDVASVADLQPGTATHVDVDGVEVALVNVAGTVYAISDICSHAEVSLSEGEVDGCLLECWLHGSRFDVRTGEPTGPPATEPVDTYAIEIVGEGPEARVLININQETTNG